MTPLNNNVTLKNNLKLKLKRTIMNLVLTNFFFFFLRFDYFRFNIIFGWRENDFLFETDLAICICTKQDLQKNSCTINEKGNHVRVEISVEMCRFRLKLVSTKASLVAFLELLGVYLSTDKISRRHLFRYLDRVPYFSCLDKSPV